jgi:Platelet-activating factor acetylhydrolase, isoform II
MYDRFVPGRTTQAFDAVRNRSFPCDVWRPAEPAGVCPIILLSHSIGVSGRRGYTFLTNHLASRGYIVAGLNHSELAAPELGHRDGEIPEQRAARAEAAIASRVPDIRQLSATSDANRNGESPWTYSPVQRSFLWARRSDLRQDSSRKAAAVRSATFSRRLP